MSNLRRPIRQEPTHSTTKALDDDLQDGVPHTFMSDVLDKHYEQSKVPNARTSLSLSYRFHRRNNRGSIRAQSSFYSRRKTSPDSVIVLYTDELEPGNQSSQTPNDSTFTANHSISLDQLLEQESYIRKRDSIIRRTGSCLTDKETRDMVEHFKETFSPVNWRSLLPRKSTISGSTVAEWLVEYGYALDSAEAIDVGESFLKQKVMTPAWKRDRNFALTANYRIC